MANTLINSLYTTYFNNDSSDTYVHTEYPERKLFYNSNMYGFASNLINLNFNLDNDFGGYKYVVNMNHAYYNCSNLTGSPVCGINVNDMNYAYYNCTNLIGSPVCGDNVVNMYYAYYNCTNLTGNPACGNSVVYMSRTYQYCSNLTGSPVCGNKVKSMFETYEGCHNLTGSPVCGDNVNTMEKAYHNCYNLTGNPVCGNKVMYMSSTYENCYNLYGDMYCYNMNYPSLMGWCFYGRNVQNILNIHCISGGKVDDILHSGDGKIYGTSLAWTDMTDGNGYYNEAYNTYVYNNLIV